MKLKYYLQKALGNLLDSPVIPKGKVVGYSLTRSEKANCHEGAFTKIKAPYFLNNVSVGDYSYISRNSIITNAAIGKFCSIGPNFCCGLGRHPINGISTSPMFYSTKKQNGMTFCSQDKLEESLHTTIGNDVFIGANVTVLDGVTISDGAVIGAGAVVNKDIPPYAVAVGVPAKVVKYRFSPDTIEALEKTRWWDGNAEALQNVEKYFFDIEEFINQWENNK